MQYGARNSKGSRRDRDRHVCKTLLGGRRKKERAAKNAARLTETSDEVRTDNRADGRTAFRFVRSATNKTVSNAKNIGKFLAGSETNKHFLGVTNGETPT